MSGSEPKADLHRYLQVAREALLWKLEGLYHRAWAHTDATIEALPLDTVGRVPWWQADGGRATLHRILVHMIAETHRHTGHADIVRELIDGFVGHREGVDNMAPGDRDWWREYRDRLERVATESDRG